MWHRRFLLFLIFPLAGLAQTGSINGVPNQAVSAATCLGANSVGVINGVSYTNCYAGSTFDARVNAAMSDAENLANGNTTGHVASENEPQALSSTAQITVGDGTHVVYWTLGAGMIDTMTLTNGATYGVLQNPKSSIICLGSVPSNRCEFYSNSTANNIDALYSTNGTGYYAVDGLEFINGGSTTTSTHLFIVNGGFDSSYWKNITAYDSPGSNPSNGAVATFTHFCCHANVSNAIFDSEWGATALDLEATSSTSFGNVNFHNITANSHGTSASGNPNVLCHDTGPGLYSKVNFTGSFYMEGQTSASQTAAWIQDNGCQALDFSGASIEAHSESTSTTGQIIDVANTFETTLNLGVVAVSGAGWGLPATIVKQHNTTTDCASAPCNVAVTDSAGNSPGYESRTGQFDNIAVGGVITNLTTPVLLTAQTSTTNFGETLIAGAPAGQYQICATFSVTASTLSAGTLQINWQTTKSWSTNGTTSHTLMSANSLTATTDVSPNCVSFYSQSGATISTQYTFSSIGTGSVTYNTAATLQRLQ